MALLHFSFYQHKTLVKKEKKKFSFTHWHLSHSLQMLVLWEGEGMKLMQETCNKSWEHDLTEWNKWFKLLFLILFYFSLAYCWFTSAETKCTYGEAIQTPATEKHKGRGNTPKRGLSPSWEGNIPETAQMCPNGVLVLLIPQEEPKIIDTHVSALGSTGGGSKFGRSAGHRCPRHHPTCTTNKRMLDLNKWSYGKIQGGKRSSYELVCIDFVFFHYKILMISTTESMFSGDVLHVCIMNVHKCHRVLDHFERATCKKKCWYLKDLTTR